MNATPDRLILLGHGSGGRLTAELVEEVFRRRLANPALDAMGDAATLPAVAGRLAMTTDGFVVKPLFFPGGDIGKLAVCGTVNDLAVSGAHPVALSAAFILEEGTPLAAVEAAAESMAVAARDCGVCVVTGDTKVVERGHGDGIFIVTTGVGRLRDDAPPGTRAVQAGDSILVSGSVGDHGAVIAASRSDLDPGRLVSDCGSVLGLVDALYAGGCHPRFLRDPTRGGLITVLAELARAARLSAHVVEEAIPVREEVRAITDILGLDPLYLACEGRVVVVVPGAEVGAALAALRSLPEGKGAEPIGQLAADTVGPVVLHTRYGGRRLYDTLASDQLPRIC